MPDDLDLSRPLGDMSEEELLAWGAKSLATGFLGGIGSAAFGHLLTQTRGRQKTLGELLESQMARFTQVVRQEIADNELRECRANTDALQSTMAEYREAPSPDRLESATWRSQDLLAQLMSLGRPAYNTFLLAAGLRLSVLVERKDVYVQNDDESGADGERRNIRNAVDQYLSHGQRMLNECTSEIISPISGIRDIGQRNEWVWTVRIRYRDLEDRLSGLDISTDEIRHRFLEVRGWELGRNLSYTSRDRLTRLLYGWAGGTSYWYKEWHFFNPGGFIPRDEAVQRANEAHDQLFNFRSEELDWVFSQFERHTNADVTLEGWRDTRAEV